MFLGLRKKVLVLLTGFALINLAALPKCADDARREERKREITPDPGKAPQPESQSKPTLRGAHN